MKPATALLLLVWAGACASRVSGPPAIVVDRSVCSRCAMLISERAYAAAVRWADGREQVFDDIGCLVAAVPISKPDGAQYWFHDVTDGEWISGVNPVFVASAAMRTPMGGGVVAHRTRAAAEEAARRQGGRVVVDLAQLPAPERGAR